MFNICDKLRWGLVYGLAFGSLYTIIDNVKSYYNVQVVWPSKCVANHVLDSSFIFPLGFPEAFAIKTCLHIIDSIALCTCLFNYFQISKLGWRSNAYHLEFWQFWSLVITVSGTELSSAAAAIDLQVWCCHKSNKSGFLLQELGFNKKYKYLCSNAVVFFPCTN